jgi:Zn-dependent protease with chaperone function
MKTFAREFIWVLTALVFAVIIGFGFGYSLNLSPESSVATIEESAFEMELFLIGAIFGFVCTYIMRLLAWAIIKQILDN